MLPAAQCENRLTPLAVFPTTRCDVGEPMQMALAAGLAALNAVAHPPMSYAGRGPLGFRR